MSYPIHWAIESHDPHVLRKFLDRGAEINQRDFEGIPAGHYLVQLQLNSDSIIEYLKILQEYGYNFHFSPPKTQKANFSNLNGNLLQAFQSSIYKKPDVVTWLINNVPDLNSVKN